MRKTFILFIAIAGSVAQSQTANPNYSVSIIAGSGARDGAPANSVAFDGPYGVAADGQGNVYIAETNAGLIWRVGSDGTLQRYAGTGRIADGNAGSAAVSTDLLAPSVLLWDGNGGLYFADNVACRIRRVRADQTIEEIAGTGTCATGQRSPFGSSGSGALDSALYPIGGMAIDSQGRLLFSESANHVVRMLDSSGALNVVAGAQGSRGFYGDSGAATSAQLNTPQGLATDPAGNLYIADYGNCRVRRVDSSGNINTFMGNKTCATSTSLYSGNASSSIDHPGALTFDNNSNALIVALPSAYRVVRLDMGSSRVSQLAGTGKLGIVSPSTPTATPVNDVSAVTAVPGFGVLLAIGSSFSVLQIQNGQVQTFAGQSLALPVGASAANLQLLRPTGLLVNSDGSLLVAETGTNQLLEFGADGTASVVAGLLYPAGFSSGGETGPAVAVTLDAPVRIARSSDGKIYLIDSARLRVIDGSGAISTVYSGLSSPAGLAIDAQDRLIISNSGKHCIIRIDPKTSFAYTVIAGTSGKAGFSNDGSSAFGALLNNPGDIAFDPQGNLLIADRGNHRVRSVSPDGTIQTIAGSGLPFSFGDIRGLAALSTGLGDIAALAVDQTGKLYISESDRVDVLESDGTLQVVTGYLSQNDDGSVNYLDGPLFGVRGLAVGPNGIYVAASNQGRILIVQPN